jgi:hypothetical protein
MRRVADLRIDLVATLILHAQLQSCGAGSHAVRQRGIDAVVIRLHIAEVFVVVLLAVWQLRLAQRHTVAGLELHAAAVEVIVRRDRPVQLQYAGRRSVGAELVGFGDGQQVGGTLRKHCLRACQQGEQDRQQRGPTVMEKRAHCNSAF